MNKTLQNWIDNVLQKDIPDNVVAFCFNLYEEADGSWGMELVGTDWFDLEDEDWACNEVTDFDTRDDLYTWEMECDWEGALAYMVRELTEYLATGTYAETLKASTGVGVGFVDGDLEILHSR